MVNEEKSTCTSTFTFDNDLTFPSIKGITLPCGVDRLNGTLTTDVISCNILLLLSRISMKKPGMMIHFKSDTLLIGGDEFKLNFTSSGHYLLTLSIWLVNGKSVFWHRSMKQWIRRKIWETPKANGTSASSQINWLNYEKLRSWWLRFRKTCPICFWVLYYVHQV